MNTKDFSRREFTVEFMEKLHDNDLVIYNPINNNIVRFTSGDIVIYNDINEANEDCLREEGEIVIKAIDLTDVKLKNELIEQINR